MPRSRGLLAVIAIGVFLLGQGLAFLYVGRGYLDSPDLVFKAIMGLTWAGPIMAWWAFRHRHLGKQEIKGYPVSTLAQLAADVTDGWIIVHVPDEDLICLADEEQGDDQAPARRLELVANEDLIVSFGAVYFRAVAAEMWPSKEGRQSQAHQAIECLMTAMVDELGLFAHQVWALESEESEDIESNGHGHIDHVSFVIKRGQQRDIDEVCAALLRAIGALRKQFALMPGEA